MVKVFEPVLKPYMQHLDDQTDIPDFYMIRPKMVFAYSHKSAMATFVSNDKDKDFFVEEVEGFINTTYEHTSLQRAILEEAPKFVFGEEKFKKMVLDAKEMIRSGDVFQIVLSNRLKIKAKLDDWTF